MRPDYKVRRPAAKWRNAFPCSHSSPTRYGDLGGSNIVKMGKHYYKFFLYETEPWVKPAQTIQCLMRTENLASASDWQIWTPSRWKKNKIAPCGAIPVIQNVRSVGFSKYLGMYVAIQWFGSRGFFFNLSHDLLNWSAPQPISITGLDTSTTPYPSLLDPTDTSSNFERPGQNPYLYYTQLNPDNLGDLMRIPLSFSIANSAPGG
jgi:hypothetical protein